MDKLLLALKLTPVAIKVLHGLSAALKWLGSGIAKAANWLGTVYEQLEGKKETPK